MRKVRHLPPKIAQVISWNTISVDLVGPYIMQKYGTIMDFVCLTILYPATTWFGMAELPSRDITHV